MEQVFITPEEAGAALRIGRQKVYDLIRNNDLVSVKVGRSRRVYVDSVHAYARRLIEEQAA